MSAGSRDKGRRYEELAAQHLIGRGFVIIARNHRSGAKEIDIIASKGGELIFVEVKGGKSREFGELPYRVDQRKQDSLMAAAQIYLQQSHIDYRGYRFDVVMVDDSGPHPAIEHIENAFTL